MDGAGQGAQVGLVLNPASRGAEQVRAEVEKACAAAGLAKPRVYLTTVEEPGGAQARAALADGCCRIVAAGGDGTVREVAGAVAGSCAALGVIPCGTANLAARGLGLPLRRPDLAARLAVAGEVRPVDLGVVELRGDGPTRALSFLVLVGVGHDADILASLGAGAKARLRWLAYLTPGLGRLRHPGRPVTVQLDDGESLSDQAWSVLAVNHAQLPMGARVVPHARPDDGLLHVTLVSPSRLSHWARIARTGLGGAGRADDHPALRYRHARVLSVTLPEPSPVQVDGDVVAGVREVRAEVLPGALLVAAAPQHHVGRAPGATLHA